MSRLSANMAMVVWLWLCLLAGERLSGGWSSSIRIIGRTHVCCCCCCLWCCCYPQVGGPAGTFGVGRTGAALCRTGQDRGERSLWRRWNVRAEAAQNERSLAALAEANSASLVRSARSRAGPAAPHGRPSNEHRDPLRFSGSGRPVWRRAARSCARLCKASHAVQPKSRACHGRQFVRRTCTHKLRAPSSVTLEQQLPPSRRFTCISLKPTSWLHLANLHQTTRLYYQKLHHKSSGTR